MAQNTTYCPWVVGGLIAKLCLTFENPWTVSPMDGNLPSSSVHGTLQARILEWVAFSFIRGPFRPRDWTQVFCIACEFFTDWVTKEAPYGGTKCPWLCLITPYYYLVYFDYFPLFIHFLTSLIKLILWLKFLHTQKKKAEDMGKWWGSGGKNHRVLLCFTVEDISISIMVRQASKFEMESEKYFKARYKIKFHLTSLPYFTY